jgi:hypothetical protein
MVDEYKFWELVRTWEHQNKNNNSADRFFHPAMAEIISMGYDVIPLLLEAIKDNYHWAMALHKITGAWPVKQKFAGNEEKIIECWVKWGKTNGFSDKRK